MKHTHPEESIGYLIADVARLMRREFSERAKPIGLPRAQWLVLGWLRRNEGISQVKLAELPEISPMTLVRLIDKLEAAGLVVRRQPRNDRRVHRVYLAPRARRRLDRVWQIGAETRRKALSGVSESDASLFGNILATMRQNLTAPTRAGRSQGDHKRP